MKRLPLAVPLEVKPLPLAQLMDGVMTLSACSMLTSTHGLSWHLNPIEAGL